MSAAARALFGHCLRLDVLEAGERGAGSRLYTGALGAVLFTSLVAIEVADWPVSVATAVLLAVSGLLAFFGILGEFAAGFLDPRDVALLAREPVAESRYFRARLLAFGVWLGCKVLAYGAVPAAVLAADGRGPWWAFASYLLALAGLLAVLAGAAVGLFLLLQHLLDPAFLRDLLVWLQVALFVLGTAGWLLLFQVSLGEAGAGLDVLAASFLPTRWFADLHLVAVGDPEASAPGALLALLCCGAVLAMLAVLSRSYVTLLRRVRQSGRVSRRGRVPPPRRAFVRLWVRREERPGFDLGVALIRRERTFRLQTYPLLVYPVLFLAFGYDQQDGGLFAILFSYLLMLYVPLAGVFLRFSDQAEAAWLVELHRAGSRAALWSGARKALAYGVVLPVGAGITLLLMPALGVAGGLAHGTLATVLALAAASRGPLPDRPPFATRFGGILEARDELARVYPLLALAVVVAVGQFWAWQTAPWLVFVLAAAAPILLTRWLRHARAEPPEPPAPARAGPPAAARSDVPVSFRARFRAELRGLLTFYGALCGWAVLVAWFLGPGGG